MKYYYFHGFGSSPEATKAQAMKEILGNNNVEVPNFNLPSSTQVKKLLKKIADNIKKFQEETLIVGSSLGGLYAIYVSSLSGCKCLLLNPCLFPQAVISKITKDFNVDDIISAQEISLDAFKNYNPKNVTVWVTNDDNLICHKSLTETYFYKEVTYKTFEKEIASGHEFNGFKEVFSNFLIKNKG